MAEPVFHVADVSVTIQSGENVAVHAIYQLQAAVRTAILGTPTLGTQVDLDRPLDWPWPAEHTTRANVTVDEDRFEGMTTGQAGVGREFRIGVVRVNLASRQLTPADAGFQVSQALAEVVASVTVPGSILGAALVRNMSSAFSTPESTGDVAIVEVDVKLEIGYSVPVGDPSTIL